MKGFGIAASAASALTLAGLFATSVNAATEVDPIVVKGSKFFYKTNGTQFFIKGVAYQQDVGTNTSETASIQYIDPLADVSSCKRDVPYLQGLGTNTIRVYAIDPTQDHSTCMQLLQDAGIYVIADLSQPGQSINRNDPAWTDDLYARYTSVVDVMANWTNTLGFFAGNEVSNQENNTAASAFVKAAVRDMKAYIKQKNYRTIGVGYATNDDADIRVNMADYFNCGSDTADTIDFWGYNIYSWCGNSNYVLSGYNIRTEEFSNYSVPAFFAEYGCNTVQPRTFSEVQALYGDQMSPVWSGGIVYMYFQETNDYGLVSVNGNSVSTLVDYTNLKSQLAKIHPSSVNMAQYTPTNTVPQDCPSVGSTWLATATPLPPTPNSQLCTCMSDSLACVVDSSVSEADYGSLFSIVCGKTSCAGIEANGTLGDYGAYGMCNDQQKLSFVLNQYYLNQSQDSSACSFGGSASLASSTSSPAGACASLMSQAGSAGTGTVTAQPTGATSTSKGAAQGVNVQHVNLGAWQLGVYVLTAAISGFGMIFL